MARVIIFQQHQQRYKERSKDKIPTYNHRLERTLDELTDKLYSSIEALEEKDFPQYFSLMADLIDISLDKLAQQFESGGKSIESRRDSSNLHRGSD